MQYLVIVAVIFPSPTQDIKEVKGEIIEKPKSRPAVQPGMSLGDYDKTTANIPDENGDDVDLSGVQTDSEPMPTQPSDTAVVPVNMQTSDTGSGSENHTAALLPKESENEGTRIFPDHFYWTDH